MFKAMIAGFLSLYSVVALAATPTFTQITETQFEDISKELSGNFMLHSVQGASTLGKIFGFEFGLVAGQQATPKIDTIVKSSGSSDGFANIYGGGLLLAVSVPLGFTGELVFIPKTSGNGADVETNSLALKYTMNESLAFLPFNLALRGFMSTSKFSFAQNFSGNNFTVSNEGKVQGFQILASPSLPFVEPYVGVGMLSAKNKLGTVGAPSSIFAPAYTTDQTAEKTVSGTQLLAGINANLVLVKLGLEYSQAFGATSYTGKLAFGF